MSKEKKKDIVRIDDSEISIYMERIIIQDSLVASIKGIQFYSIRHFTREILLKVILPKLVIPK